MIKQILLIALCLGISYQVGTAPGACSATNGYTVNGVCQYKDDWNCKTWDATGCTACITDATQDATTKRCSCPATGKINPTSAGCVVDDNAVTCLTDGFFKATNTCTKCHETCKTCTAAGNDKCLTCWGDGTGGATTPGAACEAVSATRKFVAQVGYLAACPIGYVDDANVCKRCLYGCASCAVADVLTKCLTCTEGFILVSDRCTAVAANGASGGCAATCGDKKCSTTAANCTACAADHVLSAAGTCVNNKVPLCKEYETDATKCKTCVDNATLKDNVCTCKSNTKKLTQAWAAKTGTATADTPYKNECAACNSAAACADGSVCTPTTSTAADAKDTCAAGTPANVPVTCTDETLKAAPAACAVCDATKKECTTCINTLFELKADKSGCACKADTFRKGDEFDCAALGSFDKASCKDGKVAGWDATAKAVGCITPPAATTAAATTNGLLLSAISMIAALILA